MFPRALTLFTLSGFKIRIDPSWIFIAALIVWSLSTHYFPVVFPGQPQSAYVGMAIAAMIGFFASLVLHEMAHSIVAKKHDVQIEAITLFLLGGVAELKDEPRSGRAELEIALAGPIASVVLSVLFAITSVATEGLLRTPTIPTILGYLASINLILAVFNMLPAFPLDGGRVLRAILWIRTGDALRATEIAARTGTAFAFLLIGFGMFSAFRGQFVPGIWQIILGVFLYSAAQASWQRQIQTVVFAGRTVSDVMTRNPTTVTPDTTLADLVDNIILKDRLSFLPVVEDGVLLGHITSETVNTVYRDDWRTTTVGEVFTGLEPEHVVGPENDLAKLIEHISRTGRRKYLVVEDRRLLGVVSLADLTRFLSLASLLETQRTAT